MLRLIIQRPIAVSMLFLALVLVGAVSLDRLPVDLLPSITYPRLTIITTYQDVPARDLERLITEPIEEVVTALPGARKVISRTREGVSIVTVEYAWGTQMDFAHLHLREAVDRVAFREDFPDAAERPIILRWDPLSRPISILTMSGDASLKSLSEFAEEVVKPALQQVDGISQAEIVGGEEREIVVEPDPAKLAVYGITIDQISQALARSNISFPGGRVRKGPLHLSIRISGEFESLEDIAATDIIRPGGSSIRVSDVAEVYDGTKEPEGATLLGSEPVVSFLIYKEPDANTILASKGVDKALEMLEKDYPDFRYEFVYRDADYVRASFTGLVQSLILGACLAFLVLFFFLRDFRSPVVVGLSIPISIFVTFALLYFGKVKLNLMSLGGLSLAAGMLVDNAIVVLENINRHLDEGSGSPWGRGVSGDLAGRRYVASCAEKGTSEVARAVFAATLTTVAVFFPVVYVPGIAGAFFRDQALAVTFSLLVSISTSLILQPVLSARVLSADRRDPIGLFRSFHRAFSALYDGYHALLLRALGKPKTMCAALLVFLAAAFFLAVHVDKSFMPERTSGDFRLDLELPSGTPLEETISRVSSLAAWIEDQPGVLNVFSQIGKTEHTVASLKEYNGPNDAHLRVIFEPGRHAHARSLDLQRRLEARLDSIPEVGFEFREEGVGLEEVLGSEGGTFSAGIIAENALEGLDVARELTRRLSSSTGFRNLHADRVLGTPGFVVHLDTEEILRRGLSPDQVARQLRYTISGVEATTFNEVDKRIDISVRIPREIRRDLNHALFSSLFLTDGGAVPLRTFVDLEEEQPVRELTRRNQRPMVTISSELSGLSPDDAWREVKAVADEMNLPPGVRLVPSAERQQMSKSFQDLKWAMLLAFMLVYVILAAQFESFLDPFLIAVVIPIGLAGSIITIAVTSQTINVISIIGMVALLGIGVNDAIIKVDAVKQLIASGMPGRKALLEASRLRFRPIIMTSATTILAMIPMAVGMGSGAQIQRPLALTIIGGLFFTTTLTLFYTPILYMLAHRIGREDEE